MRNETYPGQGIVQRAHDFIEGNPVAVYGSALMLVLGGAAAKAAIEAPAAYADDIPTAPTGPTGPSEPTGPTTSPGPQNQGNPATSNNPNKCTIFPPTSPCDIGLDPSTFDNRYVKGCQIDALGDPKIKNSGMILSRDIRYTLGSKKVTVKEKVSGLESWGGLAYGSSCASTTENNVSQRFVKQIKPRKPTKKLPYKAISKQSKIEGNKTAGFDPTHAYNRGAFDIKRTYTLKEKLTRKNIKNHDVCLKEVTTSTPLIQKPYVDPAMPAHQQVPGPMVAKSRTEYTCVTWTQVAKPSKKKK